MSNNYFHPTLLDEDQSYNCVVDFSVSVPPTPCPLLKVSTHFCFDQCAVQVNLIVLFVLKLNECKQTHSLNRKCARTLTHPLTPNETTVFTMCVSNANTQRTEIIEMGQASWSFNWFVFQIFKSSTPSSSCARKHEHWAFIHWICFSLSCVSLFCVCFSELSWTLKSRREIESVNLKGAPRYELSVRLVAVFIFIWLLKLANCSIKRNLFTTYNHHQQ